MKYVLPIVAFCSIFLAACKKEGDHLEGEYAVLVGTWEWYHTFGHGGTGNHGFYDLTPANYGNSYRIKFEKEGRFKTYVDGEMENSGTIKHYCDGSFTLYDRNYERYSTFLEINPDTIRFSRIPFDEIHLDNFLSRVD